LIGGGGPAVEAGVVVAPFSSGELVALRQENGRVLWTDSLATTRRLDELATLAQIHAAPVIDRGGVFAISYGGVIAAIDLRSGSRVWEQDLGGLIRPWLAGNFIYQLTKDNELICLSRNDGRVYWVTTLPAYENQKKQEDPILWAGPVLAGGRLIVVSSTGRMLSVSPYDGSIIDREQLRQGAAVAPIVVDETLYVLETDATLVAYR
jgi:outer membrane protein assembly factor BamB